jgi:putative transposase
MARMPRLYFPGVPQHVVQRGNNRQPCFFAEEDYRYYMGCLANAVKKFDCEIHAYVLMTNHVHLLVSAGEEYAVSSMMQSIGRKYVRYVNHAYRRTGTLWEGRFKAGLVQSETYLLTCSRYIELNPVRAQMVETPGEYKWSSYNCNAWGDVDECIKHHAMYDRLGSNEHERQAAYRDLFRYQMDNDLLHEIRDAVSHEDILGSSHFKETVKRVLGRGIKPGKIATLNVKEEVGMYEVY